MNSNLYASLSALTAISLLAGIASAWTGPTGTPPNSNAPEPINISTTDQFKPGVLGANILNVYGSSQYLNFGNTTGSSGFGIRNNAGVLEYKNSGGAWAALGGGGTSSQWTTSGSNINYTTGNVSIGTTTGTNAELEVDGGGQLPLQLTTASAGPWALNLRRTDLGAGADVKLFNNNAQLYTNVGAYFGGNVGIGTTNPATKLVVGPTSSGLVPYPGWHSGLTMSGALVQISASTTSTATTYTGLNLENSSQTNNTYSPFITFSRKSDSGAYNMPFASIGAIRTGVGGDTNWNGGDLVFGTEQIGTHYVTEKMRVTDAGKVGIATTTPDTKLHVNGPITIQKGTNSADNIGVAYFFDGGSQPYFTIYTKIPWVNGSGYASQVRIRGYGYGSLDFDTTVSWYEYAATFYSLGGVTKYRSELGTRVPSRVRLGVWNDAGTNRIAIEIANDAAYWTSYTVDLYGHYLPQGFASGWTTAAGAFPVAVTNIATVPQAGWMVQNNAGNVGIGTTGPNAKLDVVGNANFSGNLNTAGRGQTDWYNINTGTIGAWSSIYSYGYVCTGNSSGACTGTGGVVLNANGTITAAGNVTAAGFFHSSDALLKRNIKTSAGLEIVKKLRGVTYDWKADSTSASGVIAQEVERVMPNAVRTNEDGTKSVEYDQLIAPLIEAIKEQQLQIDELRHEIKTIRQNY